MFTSPELAHVRRGIRAMEESGNLWEHTYLVTNLGMPAPFKEAPAAVIARHGAAKKGFYLGIDANACDAFSNGQMAGVLLHEAYHIIYRHLSMRASDFPGRDQKRLTIAQEIQVNDTVLHVGADLPDNLYFGKDYLGKSSYGMSIHEIYDALNGKVSDADRSNKGDARPMSGNGDGCSHGMHESVSSAIEKEYNGTIAGVEEGLAPADPNGIGSGVGDDANTANSVLWAKENNVSPEWANLLASVSPEFSTQMRRNSVRVTRDWGRSAPHLQAYRHNGGVLVPRSRVNQGTGRKERIPAIRLAIFVDQSGSIGEEERKEAASLAASAPVDMFDIDLFVFADSVAPMTDDRHLYYIGYGTSWNPIAREANSGNYDAVLVMTDGEMNGFAQIRAKNVYYVDIMENNSYRSFPERGRLPVYPVVNMSDFRKALNR